MIAWNLVQTYEIFCFRSNMSKQLAWGFCGPVGSLYLSIWFFEISDNPNSRPIPFGHWEGLTCLFTGFCSAGYYFLKKKCCSGHRKLLVCVVKIPVSKSYLCLVSSAYSSSSTSSFSSLSYFFDVMWWQPNYLLYNHLTWILRFFYTPTDQQR